MEEYLITEDLNVLQVMERLEGLNQNVLFVHSNGKLLATITDGDIRRWILGKGALDASVKLVANYKPVFVYDEEAAGLTMQENPINAVPVVDQNMNINKIVFKYAKRYFSTFSEKFPVVIMAGGLGTRLTPYTNILPKPLIPIENIPIAEHIINRFVKCGCDEFYMIVNYKRNMLKAYFGDLDKDYMIHFIDEEKPLGTGGGLSLLKDKVKTTFILTNCDILIEDDMTKIWNFHKKSGNAITMVCSVQKLVIPYGVVNIDSNGLIESMQEKPQMSFLTNTGFYVVEPEVIEELQDDEAIDFPDIIEKNRANNKKIGVYPISENAWMDMGQLDKLELMRKRLG